MPEPLGVAAPMARMSTSFGNGMARNSVALTWVFPLDTRK